MGLTSIRNFIQINTHCYEFPARSNWTSLHMKFPVWLGTPYIIKKILLNEFHYHNWNWSDPCLLLSLNMVAPQKENTRAKKKKKKRPKCFASNSGMSLDVTHTSWAHWWATALPRKARPTTPPSHQFPFPTLLPLLLLIIPLNETNLDKFTKINGSLLGAHWCRTALNELSHDHKHTAHLFPR